MIMSDSDTGTQSSKGKQRAVETLEVEDDDQRQARMHGVFRRLDSLSSRSTSTPEHARLSNDLNKNASTESPADLLSRVQAFLPELAASNTELLRRVQEDPTSVDIENTANDEHYIEMNLGLGVFEQRGDAVPGSSSFDADLREQDDTSSVSSNSTSSFDSSASESDAESWDSSDSDSDASSEPQPSSTAAEIAARPIKPLPKRKANSRPEIVVVGEGQSKKSEKEAS